MSDAFRLESCVSSVSPVGQLVSALDTPFLIVDLDRFDQNIATMQSLMRETGVSWRPHAKAHKSPAVAHRLIAAGAIGITCAKLSEAEVYAAAGIRDILVANQVAGPIKARRLAQLAREIEIMVAVDSIDLARSINDAAAEAGSQPRVVIELNCGMNRAGAEPGEPAMALAREIVALGNLRFAGLMSWEGHVLGIADDEARTAGITESLALVTGTADAIRAAGIPVEIVSCGGTGTFLTTRGIDGVTELQAGGGIFGDTFYRKLGVPVHPALTIDVTVTSRPTPTRIITDAGRKTVDPSNVLPTVVGLEGITRFALSAEHGIIELDTARDEPRVGDRLTLQVGYSDQAVHLHEQIHAVRDGVVVAVWPTLARGKLT